MSGRQFATDRRDQQEAGSGYFAPVEQASYLLLTAFERGGAAVSAAVRGVADGDRAYFWAWSGSGSARLLRHAHAVQVTPCGARGFLTYGLPLSATARLLPGDEASLAIGKLASKHPVQHRFLIPLLQRARRSQVVVYELVADDDQGNHDQRPEGFRAPDQRGNQSEGRAVHASSEAARLHWVQTRVIDCGVASIACIWPTPAHVTSAPAKEAARQARSRAPAPPPPGTP
jgi:PPOX class probable F420-dependent enzyme